MFITIDANFEYQQNLEGLTFGIVVIHAKSNRLAAISPMQEDIAAAVDQVAAGSLIHVPPQRA